MGLLDLLKRRPANQTGRARSDSGRGHTDGFLELEELNSDLVGTTGLRVYDRMYRTDPDVRKALFMSMTPVVTATWTVPPAGGDDATDLDRTIAADVEWALGLGDDAANSTLLTPWKQHLVEFLPVVMRSGFAPGEVTWARVARDGKSVLAPRKVGLRLPRTIHRWLLDDEGELAALEQFRSSKGDYVNLPRQDLVYYRVGAEGDNWEGISMLRPCYKPWYIKDKLERVDAMGHEREALGLPVAYPPNSNVDDAIIDDLDTKLAAIRSGELAFLRMPGPKQEHQNDLGWAFDLVGVGGAGAKRDPIPSMNYHKDAIAAAFVAEFMRLGQSGTGARATADVQQDPFLMAVSALADIPRLEAQRWLVQRYVVLNYGPDVPVPQLTVSFTEGDLTDLRDYVGNLVTSGVIFADDQLEDFMRERGKLPPADPEARVQRKAAEEEARQVELTSKQTPEQPKGAERTVETTRHTRGPDGKPVKERETTKERTRTLDDAPAAPESIPAKAAGALQITQPVVGARKRKCKSCGERYDRNEHAACPECQTRALAEDEPDFHRHMALDHVEHALDAAPAQLQTAVGPAVAALASQAAVDTLRGVEGPQEPPAGLVEAFTRALTDLHRTGYATVHAELAAQRTGEPAVVLDEYLYVLAEGDELPKGIARRGWLAAKAVTNAVYLSIVGRHLSGLADPSALTDHGSNAGLQATKTQAQGQASAALNEGRDQAAGDLEALIRGSRYTSILDARRCEVCAVADDGVLRALGDPVRLARKPPNANCKSTLGPGNRCRCMEFYELDDEAPAYLAADQVRVLHDGWKAQRRDDHGRWSDGIPHPSNLKFSHKLGGSTGAWLQHDEDGQPFVTKKGAHVAHLLEEDAADRVYRAAGVRVPHSALHFTAAGPVKVARLVDGVELGKTRGTLRALAETRLRDGFVVDAVLANWDVIGLEQDNVLVDTDGVPTRIDNGGALRYRSMGATKTALSTMPLELWTMRESYQGQPVFGSLPWETIIGQARTVLDRREQLLDALPGTGQRKVLAGRLDGLQRIVDLHDTGMDERAIRERAQGDQGTFLLSRLAEGDEILLATDDWDPHKHPRDPDSGRFIVSIGGHAFEALDKYLNGPGGSDTYGRHVTKAVKHGKGLTTSKMATKKGTTFTSTTHHVQVEGEGALDLANALQDALSAGAHKKTANSSSAKQALEKAIAKAQNAHQAWVDLDGDGVQDPGEPTIPKAKVGDPVPAGGPPAFVPTSSQQAVIDSMTGPEKTAFNAIPDAAKADTLAAFQGKPTPTPTAAGGKQPTKLEAQPAGSKINSYAWEPGDHLQFVKGGHIYEVVKVGTSGNLKVKAVATGKTKLISKFKYVHKAPKGIQGGAEPGAPAMTHEQLVTAAKDGLQPDGPAIGTLVDGDIIGTPDGKVLLLAPSDGKPNYGDKEYVTAYDVHTGVKVEPPAAVKALKFAPHSSAAAKAAKEALAKAQAGQTQQQQSQVAHAQQAAKKSNSKTGVHGDWDGIPNAQQTKSLIAAEQNGTSNQLTSPQKDALKGYTNGTYSSINAALRGENLNELVGSYSGGPQPLVDVVHDLDSAFDAVAPLSQDMITHRGTSANALTGDITPGSVIYDKGYMSTSPTKPWEKPIILHIRLKKGSKAIWGPTSGGDVTSGEDEIIMRRGALMKVLQVEDVGGTKHVYVETYG